ncbi:MAG: NB-ARC domain-containing protein [Chloroflexi bacterium]|nr:NB-ARC domain-containing protein [Chloroflexota bacterium]
MNVSRSSDNFQVHIDGDISGQVAVGNNILQIGEMYGGIVNFLAPEKKPIFRRGDRPVFLLPRPFPGLLDRQEEIKTAVSSLRDSESLSLHGKDGLGKTTLLRHLAYNSPRDNFPDGIIYYSIRGQDTSDVLETVFESFYQSDSIAKPTEAELHQFLQSIHALILLDDVTLDYSKVAELVNAAPQCTFVFSAEERCLWGEGRCIELEGLPMEDALALLERELGRSLRDPEQAAAESFCQKVKGHPLYIIQAAAMTQRGFTLKEIGDQYQKSADTFVKNVYSKLTDSQKRILSVLAVSSGTALPLKHLSALCPAKDFDTALKTLLELKWVQAHSPTYSIAGSLALSLASSTNLSYWDDNLLKYFSGWFKQSPPLSDIVEVRDLIRSLLEKANRAGRWNDVITLGRGIEKALILGKRWSAWQRTLELVLSAAQTTNNRATQGWALHELGTRSLCLADPASARQSLMQALKIREALGDRAGAEVTRHNLGLLPAPPAPPREPPRSGPKSGGGFPTALKILLSIVAIGIVLSAIAVGLIFLSQPPASQPAIPAFPTQRPAAPAEPTFVIAYPTNTPYPMPTSAPQPPPCAPGIWYCENFDDNQAQGWQLDPGWSIQMDGDNYALGGSGHHFAWMWEHSWPDYQLTFHARLFSGAFHASYRLQQGNNNLIRYFIGFHQSGSYLTRQINDQFTELASVQADHSLGDWHTITIAGWGGHLRVYADGNLEIEYVDPNFLRQGAFAFETLDDSSAQIDDIEVTGPGPEPAVIPPTSTPEPAVIPPTSAPAPFVTYAPAPTPTIALYIITAAPLPIACTTYSMTWEQSTDRPGMDYWNGWVGDPDTPASQKPVICQTKCLNESNCQAFTYDTYTNVCWLKNGKPDPVYKYETISGIKVCQ